ncbi:MAG: hypothetical protein SPG61_01655 [Arcanobacterium sp.]|nr:hypothetical protein [Arcanobacterium sp.]
MEFIIFTAVVALICAFIYYVVFRKRVQTEETIALRDSYQAWRNDELKLDNFELEIKEAKVSDVFSSFEAAPGDGYLSFEEISDAVQDFSPGAIFRSNTEVQSDVETKSEETSDDSQI